MLVLYMGRDTGEQSLKSKGKKSGLREQGNEKRDDKTTLLAQKIDKEKITQHDVSSSKEHVIEIIKEGVIEHEVLKARDASEEKKETLEPLVEKQLDTTKEVPGDLKEGVIVYKGTVLKTIPGFTVIPYEEASRVEILHAKRQEEKKETHEIEVLEKQKEPFLKEIKKEKIQEQVKVVEVRKDEMVERERKETELLRKEIYSGRGLLSKEAMVKVSSLDEKTKEDLGIQRETKPGREVLKEEIADVEPSGDEHIIIKAVRSETTPEIETGLFLESVQSRMMIPLEESPKGEAVLTEKELNVESEKEHEVKRSEVAVKYETPEIAAEVKKMSLPIEKPQGITEKETEAQAQVKAEVVKEGADTDVPNVIHLTEKTQPTTHTEMDAGLLLETIPGTMTMPFKSEFTEETLQAEKRAFIEQKGEQELKRYEEEKEPVQDLFEVEEPFNRLRVEKKLKYLESLVKEKRKKTKEKEIVTEEPQREIITKKISIPGEKPVEPAKPVVEIVKSSTEQAFSETDQMEKEKGTDLREEIANTQLSEEISVKQIASPDIPEIDTGLLLTSIPGKPTIPFEKEFKTALTKEKAVDREKFKERGVKETALKTLDSKQTFDTVESKEDSFNDKERVSSTMKKIHQESETEGGKIQSESLIERIIDAPFTVKTDRFGESYQEDSQKEATDIEDRERVVEEVLIQENNRIPSQEEYAFTSEEKKRQMTAKISPELDEEIGAEEKKPFLGISLPDVFFKKDIKIEISMNDPKTTEVSFQLIKKSHPLDKKNDSLNQKEIELVEDTNSDYTLGYKRVFSTAKAEKGVYIFIIKNNGSKGYEADVVFHIFEGKSGERSKEYKTIELPSNTTLEYKFIIPEAIFWDDEDYFTGTIESSNTLTKFNEKTGLIWKERKDH